MSDTGEKGQRLKKIPAMDIILNADWLQSWLEKLGRMRVKRVINGELSQIRKDILENNFEFNFDEFKASCLSALTFSSRPSLRRIINATGVVIHTNLGRSLIADEAIEAMTEAAAHYSNLEYDLKIGARGQRNSHIEDLLCSLTGAEAAFVVNNNAGAVLLALSALAKNSEVVMSRGELVEIGGSFRIPDIMELSGAKLIETGTTNRTHLFDYERAVTEKTSMLLKIHPSNFKITGFTAAPERKDLAKLAHENNLIFMEDAGSGLLVSPDVINLPANSNEVTIKSCLEHGVDIVTFSGDKILGGPQIGGIVGKKKYIDKIKKYPMARALRVDKFTLAAFEATLRLYARENYDEIPTLRMIRRTHDELKEQAEILAGKLSVKVEADIKIIELYDTTGGGSCPEIELKGYGVSIKHKYGAAHIQKILRNNDVPILCGARDDEIILHVRTIKDNDDEIIISALERILNA
ncbi:MAG: L-seryl-tRNA(Sec) selenium transferase [Synergistales bacterium]|nr:L-seryl-tRNA(Sec) selenium transferase [Synergistales bacterium]MDY6401672.1 L-seryl-tRNA(Sec) selenium transferase [Synergistales bacterium]MDY6404248.1 L-seryl-tRNA(Sec) selenium transferase [Synergistales bacterium]MDY6411246.1 L-seryl-tRNA(Sec) selenium transferase [Synergistales bacterium]MDY6415024.1 L-seryl-tRNA(Sec) selenium transferase [Synergistales bacterium]